MMKIRRVIKQLRVQSTLLAAALLAAASLTVAGCEEPAGRLKCEGDGIKIGTILPHTGGLSSQGGGTRNAVQLAADEINAAGGVLGQQLVICHRDSGTNADQAAEQAEHLLTDGVVAIIGAHSSAVSTGLLAVTGPANIPQMSVASTAPSLSDETYGNFFRTAPSDSLQGAALSQLAKTEGSERVSIIHIEGPYGLGLAEVFEAEFTIDASYEVTAVVEYLEGLNDYSDVVAAAIADDPDTLLFIAYPAEGVTIVDNLVASGYDFDHILVSEALQDQAFVDTAGASNVEGWVGTFPTPASGSAYANFQSAFLAAYGEPSGTYTEHAYDAMYLFALAIEHAGSSDAAALLTSLSTVSATPGASVGPGEWAAALTTLQGGGEVNYEGASGNVDFDANGDVTGAYKVWRIVSGAIVDEYIITP